MTTRSWMGRLPRLLEDGPAPERGDDRRVGEQRLGKRGAREAHRPDPTSAPGRAPGTPHRLPPSGPTGIHPGAEGHDFPPPRRGSAEAWKAARRPPSHCVLGGFEVLERGRWAAFLHRFGFDRWLGQHGPLAPGCSRRSEQEAVR